MKIIQRNILFYICFLIVACANPGTPSGGPKDITPPIVRKAVPMNYSTNFSNDRINITFSEYIQLNNINENLFISPPQKNKPRFKVKGKSIDIKFVDTLKKNTTYILDLTSAIVDNNERLPLVVYRYVFSTGNVIDSLGINGSIRNAYDHSIPEKAIVCLFENEKNQELYEKFPSYISKIDSNGHYIFTNIADKAYRLIGLQDVNKNNKIDKGEPIAFYDFVVIPPEFIIPETNEFDSIDVAKSKMGFINENLNLFEEKPNKQHLKNYSREKKNILRFEFNLPREDTLYLNFLGIEKNSDWYLLESSVTNDTIIYWITDSTIYNQEKLVIVLQYLKTDSIGKLNLFNDTVNLNYKTKGKKKVKKDKTLRRNLKINDNIGKVVHILQKIFVEFDEPVINLNDTSIKVFQLNGEQKNHIKTTLQPDTLKAFRKYWINANWQESKSYEIQIDSAEISSIYDAHNFHYKKNFSIKESTYYGNIFVTFNSVKDNMIIQLISNNVIKYEKNISEPGIVSFQHVIPGNYTLKAIMDKNKDNKWTSGNFSKSIQPEKIIFYNETIELKSNWDINIIWNLYQ